MFARPESHLFSPTPGPEVPARSHSTRDRNWYEVGGKSDLNTEQHTNSTAVVVPGGIGNTRAKSTSTCKTSHKIGRSARGNLPRSELPLSRLTYTVENHIQAVVDARHPVPQPVEIESILDVAALHLAEHLVPLECTEPRDPRIFPIVRRRGFRHIEEASRSFSF